MFVGASMSSHDQINHTLAASPEADDSMSCPETDGSIAVVSEFHTFNTSGQQRRTRCGKVIKHAAFCGLQEQYTIGLYTQVTCGGPTHLLQHWVLVPWVAATLWLWVLYAGCITTTAA